MSSPVQLTLYVADDSPASRRARDNLAQVIGELRFSAAVQVVDVAASPEQAIKEHVFITPALLLKFGARREMLVGDLSQREALRLMLASIPSADG